MGDVFAFEKRNVSICAVDVFLYMPGPERWGVSVSAAKFLTNYWR